MPIRKATVEDAPAILAVHVSSIQGLCGPQYGADAIAEWTGALAVDRYVARMAEFEFFVAEEAGAVVGFAALDTAGQDLHALYVAPVATGRGVGRALVAVCEELARSLGLSRLTVRATLNAVSFYEQQGFTRVGSSRHALPSGRELACEDMVKVLAS